VRAASGNALQGISASNVYAPGTPFGASPLSLHASRGLAGIARKEVDLVNGVPASSFGEREEKRRVVFALAARGRADEPLVLELGPDIEVRFVVRDRTAHP
jgi:hypothetical protein